MSRLFSSQAAPILTVTMQQSNILATSTRPEATLVVPCQRFGLIGRQINAGVGSAIAPPEQMQVIDNGNTGEQDQGERQRDGGQIANMLEAERAGDATDKEKQ